MFNGMNGLEILKNWPRYEDGTMVCFGDDVSRHGEDFEANVIALYRDGSFSLNFWAYSKGERVKRPAPKVLDADGVPIKVGETVWHEDGTELRVLGFKHEEDGERIVSVKYMDGPTNWSEVRSLSLTHERPESKCRECAHWQKDPTADNMGVCWFFYHEYDGEDCYAARRADIGACEEFTRRAKKLAGDA